jgi:hypothetical protein
MLVDGWHLDKQISGYMDNSVVSSYDGYGNGDMPVEHVGMIEIAPQDTKIMSQNHPLCSWERKCPTTS